MKKVICLILIGFVIHSCSKEGPVKVEAFSSEAFAFDLGDIWEVNASTIVKGFVQEREEDNYLATIAYDIDLITPDADTIKSLISRVEDKIHHERIIDIKLEAQFELDSNYSEGDYTIVFNVKDANSGQSAVTTASFTLINE
jgi:hypothetical protein